MNGIVIMTLVGAGICGAFALTGLVALIVGAIQELWERPTTDNVLAVVFFCAASVTVTGLIILVANGVI
jgi:hypothetical protein